MFMATLLEIIQPYKFLIGKRVDMDECIVRKETNIVSINNLCDESVRKAVLEELSCEMGNIKIFQQIEHRKRRTIVNYIIIMDYFRISLLISLLLLKN